MYIIYIFQFLLLFYQNFIILLQKIFFSFCLPQTSIPLIQSPHTFPDHLPYLYFTVIPPKYFHSFLIVRETLLISSICVINISSLIQYIYLFENNLLILKFRYFNYYSMFIYSSYLNIPGDIWHT